MMLDDYNDVSSNGKNITIKNDTEAYSLPTYKSHVLKALSKDNYIELIAIVKNNHGELFGKVKLNESLMGYVKLELLEYKYNEPIAINNKPSDEPCSYENTNILPGQVYDEGSDNGYISSNSVKSKKQRFSLTLSSEQIENDNKLYTELADNLYQLDNNSSKYYNIYSGRRMALYKAQANLSSKWYTSDFNPFSYSQCTWYTYGRIGEVHNLKLNFTCETGRDGGKWLGITKNATIVDEYGATSNNKVIIIENNYYNIKSQSAILYMYNNDGHVMFVEAVKRNPTTGEPVSIIFSDSWYGRSEIGVFVEIDMNTLINEYNTSKKANNSQYPRMNDQNINFQGYIQFN